METKKLSLDIGGLVVHRGSRRRPGFTLGPLSASLACGSVTALVGHNGSGKSTLYNALCDLVRPTEGGVQFDRFDHRRNEADFKQRVGFVSDFSHIYGGMSVELAIRFASSFYDHWDSDYTEKMLVELRLPRKRAVKDLSKGMKTKLSLVLTLASRRQFLVLDEPTSGLDVGSTHWFWKQMKLAVGGGMGLLLSLHSYEQVVDHCDRVLILENGRLRDDVDLHAQAEAKDRVLNLMSEVGS
mgnify:CR=1 FL=1